jgi:NADH pyrophosphatase NudC (nudix superfamily)
VSKATEGVGKTTPDAGLFASRPDLEVLLLLPDTFVRAYTQLFHTALRDIPADVKDPDSQREHKPKRAGKIQGAGGGGKKFIAGRWVIRSPKALERKRYVDRQLRKLARWITTEGMRESELTSRCSGCGVWTEEHWRFCPRCGVAQ